MHFLQIIHTYINIYKRVRHTCFCQRTIIYSGTQCYPLGPHEWGLSFSANKILLSSVQPTQAMTLNLQRIQKRYAVTCTTDRNSHGCINHHYRADSRFAPSQRETSLQSNAVSDWLGANLVSTLLLQGSRFSSITTIYFDINSQLSQGYVLCMSTLFESDDLAKSNRHSGVIKSWTNVEYEYIFINYTTQCHCLQFWTINLDIYFF